MSDYSNIPMGEDEEVTDDDINQQIDEFMYNSHRENMYYGKENETKKLADEKRSDELAAENTKKIVSFIQIAVLMCSIWFI